MSGHGGNIFQASCNLGIAEEKLLDFSASINPLGVPDSARKAIIESIEGLRHYPEAFASPLSEAVSDSYGIPTKSIIPANGSIELIYLLPRALKPKLVLITSPTFSEYESAVGLAGAKIKRYALKESDGFRIDPEEFVKKADGCDMAFLCNPNNPTGSLLNKDETRWIITETSKRGCRLVIDEAFIDFTVDESVIHEPIADPNVIVLRSMTKFYALSGLRIGFGVFHPMVAKTIRKFKEPWSVNRLAEKAGAVVLADIEYARATHEIIKKEKAFMEREFAKLGIKFYPSAVNYYLLKIKNAKSVVEGLAKKGILVRSCANFRGLSESYIRVAVRSRKENTKLLREMGELCEG